MELSVLKHLLLFFMSCGMTLETVEGRYRCTIKDFIRLGNSCYFLSAEIAKWQEAHFRCRDKGAQLAVLASHYEDSTLRNYLERPEFAQLGRWIGGMWASKWIWAAQGSSVENEQSFASTDAFQSQNSTHQWICLYMDPSARYLWNGENCMTMMHYVCEAPLARAENSTENEYPLLSTSSKPTSSNITYSHSPENSESDSNEDSASQSQPSSSQEEDSTDSEE